MDLASAVYIYLFHIHIHTIVVTEVCTWALYYSLNCHLPTARGRVRLDYRPPEARVCEVARLYYNIFTELFSFDLVLLYFKRAVHSS